MDRFYWVLVAIFAGIVASTVFIAFFIDAKDWREQKRAEREERTRREIEAERLRFESQVWMPRRRMLIRTIDADNGLSEVIASFCVSSREWNEIVKAEEFRWLCEKLDAFQDETRDRQCSSHADGCSEETKDCMYEFL